MINKVILVGNVGNDPEVQYVQEDVPVAKFSLATNERYTNKNGEKVDQTQWHNIVVWRGLAKVVEQYVKKGDRLYLEGKLEYRSYEVDGVTKYYTSIICREMKMLGGVPQSTDRPVTTPKKTASNNTNPPPANVSPASEKDAPVAFDGDDMNNIDDLPF